MSQTSSFAMKEFVLHDIKLLVVTKLMFRGVKAHEETLDQDSCQINDVVPTCMLL